MDKNNEQLYRERLKRMEDAVQLKVPDRVPIICDFGLLPARYSGLSTMDAYYELEKWAKANKDTILEFQPDMFHCTHFFSGVAWDAVDTKLFKWPSPDSPSEYVHQFVEGEYMKSDEYDAFLDDPSDFIIRTYLPRISGVLSPLKKLDVLTNFSALGSAGGPVAIFDDPEFIAMAEALGRAAKVAKKWNETKMNLIHEMSDLGFPAMYSRAAAQAPFDYISDMFRGLRGTMVDMYRQPEKLLEVMDKLLPKIIKRAKTMMAQAREHGNALLFMGPHKGADSFMSLDQFEKYYWPGMKSVIVAMVEAGVTPYVFWEGDYTSRLEHLLELPEGKVINRFDMTDIFRVKEVLGGHQCIAGGMPASLMKVGTVQEIKDHCKKLIDVVGKDGGYILTTSCSMDEAKPENVKAMIDFTKEYGVYN